MSINSAWLRDRFIDRLLALSPGSVLDVGCGRGGLVRACLDQGVGAIGVEPGEGGALAAQLEGNPVARADAARLPLPSGAVDWVTLRHVPHHLEHLSQALAEAWRVARVGVLMGEPGYAPEGAEGQEGLRADRWLKRMDRRRGMFHADVLSADELLACLPGEPGRVTREFLFKDLPWSAEDLHSDRAKASAGLEVSAEDEAEWASIAEAAQRGGVGDNGTTLVAAWKPG